MITDLILAGVSFVGLLVYATIAVAIFKVSYPRLERGCNYNGCMHYLGAMAVGIFWIVTLPSVLFWNLVLQLAKGPAAWGTWLADLGTHRANRKQALRKQVEDRDTYIRELEKECGIAA